MSVSALFGNPKPQFFVGGIPAVGYRLFFYAATTSTKQNTYTDSTAVTTNSNPITLDAEGYPTGNVMIYGTDNVGYKIILAPPGSDDPPTSTTWSIDLIYTTASGLVQVGTTVVNYTATVGQTLFSLPAGTIYGIGNNSLAVYLGNGAVGGRLRLTEGQDYTETSTSSFTLSYGTVAGDRVTAIIGQVLASPSTLAASSVIFTSGDSVQNLYGSQGLQNYPLLSTETGGNVLNYEYPWNNVLRYIPDTLHAFIKDKTGTTDLYSYFVNALADHDDIICDYGLYQLDTMVSLTDNQSIYLAAGATLIRTTASASTDPVVWLKGNYAALKGKNKTSIIQTQNKAPYGIVRIGHQDLTTSHANMVYCDCFNLKIVGQTAYGQTSGTPDTAIYMANPQFTGLASYFHHVDNIEIDSVNYGIQLAGFANANQIDNIQLYRVGNSTGGRAGIWINGAQENMIGKLFHHSSPDSYTIVVDYLDNTGSGGTTHTPHFNQVGPIVSEQGGASARCLVVNTIGNKNTFWHAANTGSGDTLPSNFYTNNNSIIGDGSLKTNTVVSGTTITAGTQFIAQNHYLGYYVTKSAIDVAQTGIIDITMNSGYVHVVMAVQYQSGGLQSHFDLRATATGGTVGYSSGITSLYNGSAGNFQAIAGDFAVTRPSNGVVRITYTCSNVTGTNTIYVFCPEALKVTSVTIT